MFRFVSVRAATALAVPGGITASPALWYARAAYHPSQVLLDANRGTDGSPLPTDAKTFQEAIPQTTAGGAAATNGSAPSGQWGCHGPAHGCGRGGCGFFPRILVFFFCFGFFMWMMRLIFGVDCPRSWGGGPGRGGWGEHGDGERRGPWGWRHDLPWWAPTSSTAQFLAMRSILSEREMERIREEFGKATTQDPTLTLERFMSRQYPHLLDGRSATQAETVAAIEMCLRSVKTPEVARTIRHAVRGAKDSSIYADAIVSALKRDHAYAFKE